MFLPTFSQSDHCTVNTAENTAQYLSFIYVFGDFVRRSGFDHRQSSLMLCFFYQSCTVFLLMDEGESLFRSARKLMILFVWNSCFHSGSSFHVREATSEKNSSFILETQKHIVYIHFFVFVCFQDMVLLFPPSVEDTFTGSRNKQQNHFIQISPNSAAVRIYRSHKIIFIRLG